MKKIKTVIVIVGCVLMTGCMSRCQNEMKHWKSSTIGLDREITLYGADGHIIKQWRTRATVEDRGGSCYFLDNNGRAIIIAGTFTIEEQ